MLRYITVAGTNAAGKHDWDCIDSPFTKFLEANEYGQLVPDVLERYEWSTALDGVEGDNNTWDASGRALRDYFIPPLYHQSLLAAKDTFIISHSHGGNVVAYACGKYGLKINGLITVGTPIRGDMYDMYKAAHENIDHHLHLHGGWKDYWQVFGALFDGRFGIHREHPFAVNIKVPGGHGSVLREQKYFPLWVSRKWLPYWGGTLLNQLPN